MPFQKQVIKILSFTALASICLFARAQDYVCMETNLGDFCMELLPESAPQTVANFLNYVNDGDYENSLIHRSVQNFVIQGGGYFLNLNNLISQVPTDATIPNEFERSNLRGTVAMAKLGNDPNSASSQWFINLANNSSNLDFTNGGFTVFAEIIYGMEVVDLIAAQRIANLSADLGSAFQSLPITTPAGSNTVNADDLILVQRAYVTSEPPNPYLCSLSSPEDTLTEFCGTYVRFPVEVNGVFYSARLDLTASQPALSFRVDTASLAILDEEPGEFAVYNLTTGLVDIPTVRVGDSIVRDVILKLTNASTLEFVLEDYSL